jgi:hypothetical protein
MENILIEPGVGVGTIKLGMSREEVDLCIQAYTNAHQKLYYDNEYFHYAFKIEYDQNERASFIEVASHVKEEFNCLVNGIDVFNTKAEELVKAFDKISPYERDHADLGWTYFYPKLGITLWRSRVFIEPDIDEEWFKEMSLENQKDELEFLYFETVSVSVPN